MRRSLFVFILILKLFERSKSDDEILIETSSGFIEGTQTDLPDGSGILEFLGIPYAQPPIGDLRFAAPVGVLPSKEIIKASSKSKACIQVVTIIEVNEELAGFLPSEQSEDCLYLNVWTPSPRPKDAAVMVWIHGGGYELGTANSPSYEGKALASQGVIVVSMNYRLSALGFLIYDKDEIPGNMGLMDQALAMKWVQDNIVKFGGDPNKVTIFGESAGAGSVAHHLVIPSSQGLFQRAIMESGSFHNVWSYYDKKTAEDIAIALIEALGCKSKQRTEVIKCLRMKDTKELVQTLQSKRAGLNRLIFYTPVIDGYYYPDEPVKLVDGGLLNNKINILMGASEDDGMIVPAIMTKMLGKMTDDTFITEDNFLEFLKAAVGTQTKEVANVVKFVYTDYGKDAASFNWRRAVADFSTDYYFMCKAADMADRASKNGNQVHFYQFDYKPSLSFLPNWAGANHGDELALVFGIPLLQPDLFSKDDVEISRKLTNYWTQFAKSGNPNSAGNTDWPSYTTSKKAFITLNLNTSSVKTGIRLQRCGFLNEILPGIL